jgi:hypothetical protein
MRFKEIIMAYSGFISNDDYARKSFNENISGQWTFDDITTFNKVVRGTAIATYYADLAEYYECSDLEILPAGTLIKFGGDKEITKTGRNDTDFFGIISSKPGVVLNENKSNNNLPVALFGKVPCRVNGKIKKHDKLTTSKIPGVAKRKTFLDKLFLKPTIGVALEDKNNTSENLIEIFVRAGL